MEKKRFAGRKYRTALAKIVHAMVDVISTVSWRPRVASNPESEGVIRGSAVPTIGLIKGRSRSTSLSGYVPMNCGPSAE